MFLTKAITNKCLCQCFGFLSKSDCNRRKIDFWLKSERFALYDNLCRPNCKKRLGFVCHVKVPKWNHFWARIGTTSGTTSGVTSGATFGTCAVEGDGGEFLIIFWLFSIQFHTFLTLSKNMRSDQSGSKSGTVSKVVPLLSLEYQIGTTLCTWLSSCVFFVILDFLYILRHFD